MTGIIFSRNRPMQLDGLLSSIKQFAYGFFDQLFVLYRADEAFEKAYELLQSRYEESVTFFSRTQLKADMQHALVRADEWSCFLTDDDLFYRPIDNSFWPYITEEVICMTFRLGLNTRYCYPVNKDQALPDNLSINGLMKWKWRDAQWDFAYPLSIDGNIFPTRELVEATSCADFQTPTEFEDRWQTVGKVDRPLMLSYTHSRLVNLPVNMIQTAYPNRNEGGSAIELSEKYLQGYVLDREAMDFSSVTAAHQPLQLQFRRAYS